LLSAVAPYLERATSPEAKTAFKLKISQVQKFFSVVQLRLGIYYSVYNI
jgi:hypothetical protein